MSGQRSAFRAARWNEPLITELSESGARGVVPPAVDAGIVAAVGDVAAKLPAGARRAPGCPCRFRRGQRGAPEGEGE